MNSVTQPKSDMLSDFFKGAVKGIIVTTLVMGVVALTFAGITPLAGIIGLAAPTIDLLGVGHLASSIGLIIAGGITNGLVRAYQGSRVNHHMSRNEEREARVVASTPTIIPLIGIDHGSHLDAVEMEQHTHASQRNWRETTNHRGGDRVQEILQNGSMSDKDRAAAILAEREARAVNPQTQSL